MGWGHPADPPPPGDHGPREQGQFMLTTGTLPGWEETDTCPLRSPPPQPLAPVTHEEPPWEFQ